MCSPGPPPKPRPAQSSQVELVRPIMPRSMSMVPKPWHDGHAPSELALNSDGVTLFVFANDLRMGSSIPVYVAGLERRPPLIGD